MPRTPAGRHRHHVVRYQPPTASIVVDANSGKVLQESHADSPRHPASLTKMMTLYLLFERLAAGKIKMSTPLTVSAHAAAQAPSKLGLKPGQTHPGRGRHQGHRHQVGQRRGGGGGRSDRRQRARLRPDDDRQGARARHDAHQLPQRLRPARRPADHHRARPGDPRPRPAGPLPAIFPFLLDPHLRLARAARCATTTTCSAACPASTASRPAISAPPASTSWSTSIAPTAISSPSCSAAARRGRAMRGCAA